MKMVEALVFDFASLAASNQEKIREKRNVIERSLNKLRQFRRSQPSWISRSPHESSGSTLLRGCPFQLPRAPEPTMKISRVARRLACRRAQSILPAMFYESEAELMEIILIKLSLSVNRNSIKKAAPAWFLSGR
jgi:hypothetical protein